MDQKTESWATGCRPKIIGYREFFFLFGVWLFCSAGAGPLFSMNQLCVNADAPSLWPPPKPLAPRLQLATERPTELWASQPLPASTPSPTGWWARVHAALPACPVPFLPRPRVCSLESASLFLPCKRFQLHHFSRFHIYALVWEIRLSLSDSLHSVADPGPIRFSADDPGLFLDVLGTAPKVRKTSCSCLVLLFAAASHCQGAMGGGVSLTYKRDIQRREAFVRKYEFVILGEKNKVGQFLLVVSWCDFL